MQSIKHIKKYMLFSSKILNLPVFATQRQILATSFSVSSNVNDIHVYMGSVPYIYGTVYGIGKEFHHLFIIYHGMCRVLCTACNASGATKWGKEASGAWNLLDIEISSTHQTLRTYSSIFPKMKKKTGTCSPLPRG